jgi:tRNA dimethylallyltransferase
MKNHLVTILGPTAVGKTKFAAQLAYHFNGEIISADSRQVYKYMDIGTGKDLDDYRIQNSNIAYHLIDIIDPTEEYNVFEFQKDFYRCFKEILKNEKIPFLVGGTGMYLSAILQEYKLPISSFNEERVDYLKNQETQDLKNTLLKLKPEQHNETDLIDRNRLIKAILIAESSSELNTQIKKKSIVIGISLSREQIKKRITARLKDRLKNGMIEEAEILLQKGVSIEKLKFFGLEYKFLALYLEGELNYNDMFQKLNSSIHKFAKRQMTWFRKMEREGVKINWFNPDEFQKAKESIKKFLDA